MKTIYLFTAVVLVAASALAADKNALIANLKDGKAQTIVTYGTSLTACGAWVKQLQDALDKKFPGLAKVINGGWSGMWSKWGVDNLDRRVISKQPDAVFIEFAINDAHLKFATSPADARRNLETMIDRILLARPQCQIILMTMDPPIGKAFECRPKIEDYYDVYRQVAKERKFLLIDHELNWKTILDQDKVTFKKYVPDGLHPNALGCEKVILPQLLKSLAIEDAK